MAAKLAVAQIDAAAGLGDTFFYSYPQFAGTFPAAPVDSWFSIATITPPITRCRRRCGEPSPMAHIPGELLHGRSRSTPVLSTPPLPRLGCNPLRSEPLAHPFDLDNRKRNYAPSDFDRTHVFQSIWVYELPFGHGKRWGKGVNGLVGQSHQWLADRRLWHHRKRATNHGIFKFK